MSSGDESRLVSSIVLDIIHHVAWDLGVTFWNWCSQPEVARGVVFIDLSDFQIFGVLPFPVAIFLVDEDSFFMASWHLIPILVTGTVAVVPKLHLVSHAS